MNCGSFQLVIFGPDPCEREPLLMQVLQRFLDQAPVAVAMLDREWRYVSASRRWLEDFKLDRSIIGRCHYEVFPDIPERWKEINRRALNGETLSANEDRFERADGSVYWLRWETGPWRRDDGEIGGVIIFSEDVSERKNAEMALRASEERFRAIFDRAGSGIGIADLEGRLQQANPTFCRMLGYTAEELIGRPVFELVHPEDQAFNLLQFQRLRNADVSALELDHRYVAKNGRHVWVHKSASLLRNGAGQVEAILALITDITPRREMEQALRDADRRKDEFLATLAHELRNPLTPIRNAVYIFKNWIKGDAPAGFSALSLLDMVERQVDHLVRLVDDLLDVARITTGKIILKKQHVDLNEIISHAIDIGRPMIQACGQELCLSIGGEPLICDGDPVRLSQVLSNLLNNAAKYTARGGRIEVRAERQGDEAVLTVADTGVGIPAKMLPHVFDLFAQVDSTLGRAQGGLGIGLALVRRLVEMHGGEVEAQSEGQGRGSRFIVRLPMKNEAKSARPTQPPALRSLASAPRVLVVDDSIDVADSLSLLLRTLGATARVAYGGAEALAAFTEFRPELVLLDLGMPRMDGFETARRMRESSWGRKATLIALTGWGEEGTRRRAIEAGFDTHMTKPADLGKLQALLDAVPRSKLGEITNET